MAQNPRRVKGFPHRRVPMRIEKAGHCRDSSALLQSVKKPRRVSPRTAMRPTWFPLAA